MGDMLGKKEQWLLSKIDLCHLTLISHITSVPENSAPVAAGTVICTTLNEGHDDKSKPDDVEDCDLEGSSKKEGNEKKDI